MDARARIELSTGDGATVVLHPYGDDGEEVAARPAVVLCHGFIQSHRAFTLAGRSFARALHDAGFAVWTVDLRGRHDDKSHARAHRLIDYVDHDAPTLLAHVARRHRRIAWVGHSMGGLIGASLRGEARALLSAVVTIGSPYIPGNRALHAVQAPALLHRLGRAMQRRGATIPGARWSWPFATWQRVFDDARVPLPLRLWAPGSMTASVRDAAVRETFHDDGFGVLADLADLARNRRGHAGALHIDERLAQLRAPLLVIAGDDDDLAPPAGVRELFVRAGSVHKQWFEAGRHTTGQAFGHIDLLVGDRAPDVIWPLVTSFLDDAFARAV